MENMNIVESSLVKRIFDLKGSTFKRKTNQINKISNLKTLKDLDYLWMKKVDPEVKKIKKSKFILNYYIKII
jgi:hypothetical protein